MLPTLAKLQLVLVVKDDDSKPIREMKKIMNDNLDKRYQKQEVKDFLIVPSFLHPLFKSLSFLTTEEKNGAKALLHSAATKMLAKGIQPKPIKQEQKHEGATQPELPSLPLSEVLPSLPVLPIKQEPCVQSEDSQPPCKKSK